MSKKKWKKLALSVFQHNRTDICVHHRDDGSKHSPCMGSIQERSQNSEGKLGMESHPKTRSYLYLTPAGKEKSVFSKGLSLNISHTLGHALWPGLDAQHSSMALLCKCEFFHLFLLFCLWVFFLYLHFSVLFVYCLSILIFVFLGFYLTEGKNIRLGR